MNVEIFDLPLQATGGGTVTCSVYVGEVIEGVHPLEQQDRWFRRERDLAIPQEVMESFGKLAEMSLENNVSFSELCAYAMGEGAKEPAPSDGEGG